MSSTTPVLTERDLLILRTFAAGGTYANLAEGLKTSESSVRHMASRMFVKLGAVSMPQAMFLACERGLLPAQPPDTKAGEVRIGPSLRLLRSLMAEGFSVSFIAARMGMGQSELSLLMNRFWVTTIMERRIRLAFLELAGRDPLVLGVHQRGCTRARNRARVEGWEVVSAAEVQQMRTTVPHAA